jgi:hypothetical protein
MRQRLSARNGPRQVLTAGNSQMQPRQESARHSTIARPTKGRRAADDARAAAAMTVRQTWTARGNTGSSR